MPFGPYPTLPPLFKALLFYLTISPVPTCLVHNCETSQRFAIPICCHPCLKIKFPLIPISDVQVLECALLLYANFAVPNYSGHCSCLWSINILKYCSNFWFTLSVCPSVWGWNAIDNLCQKAKLHARIKLTALCSVFDKENSIEFLLDLLHYIYNYYVAMLLYLPWSPCDCDLWLHCDMTLTWLFYDSCDLSHDIFPHFTLVIKEKKRKEILNNDLAVLPSYDNWLSIPNILFNSCIIPAANWGPQSKMIVSDNPYNFYTLFLNNCANPSADVLFIVGIKCTIFVNLLTTTKIKSYSWAKGSLVIICQYMYLSESQLQAGIKPTALYQRLTKRTW